MHTHVPMKTEHLEITREQLLDRFFTWLHLNLKFENPKVIKLKHHNLNDISLIADFYRKKELMFIKKFFYFFGCFFILFLLYKLNLFIF